MKHHRWLSVLVGALVLFISASSISGQSRGRIEGVVNVGAAGLSGVSVEILKAGQVVASVVSGPDGRFAADVSVSSRTESFDVRLGSTTFGTRTLRVDLNQRQAAMTEGDLTIFLEFGLLATAAPAPPPTRGFPEPPAPSPPPTPETASDNHAIIKVFFATDRATLTSPALDYGGGRAAEGKLTLGRFDVSVPRDRLLGSIERPTIWTFWREDPNKHFIIVRRAQHSYDSFYGEVSQIVRASQRKEAFVFVHGYNVTFETAVYRTAQLAYDLGFDGAPILYSWPSQGTAVAYPVDSNNAEWTTPHLRWFLEDVAAKSGAQVIHVIAHSMGNRPVVNALREIASSPRTGPRPHFQQVVLTAPDIDVDTFRQLAGAVTGSADRITLYASSNDVALQLSKRYQGYQRLGDSSPSVVVMPGIDTIDVSNVETGFLGHSYYGDNKTVLTDLFALIHNGSQPNERFGLRVAGQPPRRWWIFQP